MAVKKWTWLWISATETSVRKLIELLNLRLKQLAEALGTLGSVGDELNAVEAYLWNNGSQLVAGDSDWVFVPFDFTITLAEIVADSAGNLSVDVYAADYPTWDTWTLISASAPIALAGQQKHHPPLTGWTTSFTGGTYLKFVVTGAPVLITKATITLELSVPNALLSGGDFPTTAGGVLSGEYPNPGFAEDMATQAELNAEAATRSGADSALDTRVTALEAAGSVDLTPYRTAADQDTVDAAQSTADRDRANHTGTQLAATISDFASSARAQTEAELVAGTNVTITPSGSGATRQLTIAASGGGSAITVKDEGSTLTATPASMNFTGAGVTASVDGSNNVTVNVPGTSASRMYWMLVVEATQGAGANARIGELQLRATSGGANLATGGTPIYMDQFSASGDNSASAAFDGNSATAWASASTAMPSGVGYQLASASAVNEIVITTRNDSFGPDGAPYRFTLYSSSDGTSYQREWSVLVSSGWTAGLSRTFTRPT